jgi:hypothetical protein
VFELLYHGEIFFFHFFDEKGGPLSKKYLKFFFFKYDNSYTNRKPISSLFETCCYEKYLKWYLAKKTLKPL